MLLDIHGDIHLCIGMIKNFLEIRIHLMLNIVVNVLFDTSCDMVLQSDEMVFYINIAIHFTIGL